MENEKKRKRSSNPDAERFYKLLHTLFHVCELAGFEVKGRITLRDRKTGKMWE